MDGENFMENPMKKWQIWWFSHYFWKHLFGKGLASDVSLSDFRKKNRCPKRRDGSSRVNSWVISENWLVVEPTHLKNMLVKMGSSSPSFGVKIKNI